MAAPAEKPVAALTFMKIKKIKVKKGQKISKGTLYCLYTSHSNDIKRLKSNDNGLVSDIFIKEGEEVDEGFVQRSICVIIHPYSVCLQLIYPCSQLYHEHVYLVTR